MVAFQTQIVGALRTEVKPGLFDPDTNCGNQLKAQIKTKALACNLVRDAAQQDQKIAEFRDFMIQDYQSFALKVDGSYDAEFVKARNAAAQDVLVYNVLPKIYQDDSTDYTKRNMLKIANILLDYGFREEDKFSFPPTNSLANPNNEPSQQLELLDKIMSINSTGIEGALKLFGKVRNKFPLADLDFVTRWLQKQGLEKPKKRVTLGSGREYSELDKSFKFYNRFFENQPVLSI